ncbi:hypothetical protein BCV69DRAFT_301960 [Microstroma glucosiphilum]|uniref:Uncharacterized protein n=1 Tax=Pseudomicrostroma glucosiphilum TaxID=1684307 RepID=A0A316U414_9BASI|nr:hypothetical protein BCV69DRAFT_301960 [Pseudomicrostroma glucosiphilum]PWN17655.1 hypothetical protein BCV69DRAFT_301960 [Pseudomicrostroma glucosiphilum]
MTFEEAPSLANDEAGEPAADGMSSSSSSIGSLDYEMPQCSQPRPQAALPLASSIARSPSVRRRRVQSPMALPSPAPRQNAQSLSASPTPAAQVASPTSGERSTPARQVAQAEDTSPTSVADQKAAPALPASASASASASARTPAARTPATRTPPLSPSDSGALRKTARFNEDVTALPAVAERDKTTSAATATTTIALAAVVSAAADASATAAATGTEDVGHSVDTAHLNAPIEPHAADEDMTDAIQVSDTTDAAVAEVDVPDADKAPNTAENAADVAMAEATAEWSTAAFAAIATSIEDARVHFSYNSVPLEGMQEAKLSHAR